MVKNFWSRNFKVTAAGTGLALFAGWAGLQAQEARPADETRLERQANFENAQIEHTDCANFGPTGEKLRRARLDAASYKRSKLAEEISSYVERPSTFNRSAAVERQPAQALADGYNGLIDKHIFGALQDANVRPAAKIDDYEFIRRASLDLTGRVPVYERVLSFVADKDPNKRVKLVDELLASPLWTDKWQMYFGDKFKNATVLRTTNVNRFANGRDAFAKWIRESLQSGKGYDQMAREMIGAKGDNSYEQGELNWVVGWRQTNGPAQDIYDKQALGVAETFLGVSHMDCVLCHDGRGHLDSLSLWGRNAKRMEAWGLAAYFAKSTQQNVRVDPAQAQPFYWRVVDQTAGNDYALNTTSGNRPNRQPAGTVRTVSPKYPMTGQPPAGGMSYRESLGRQVTADPLFAMASVNNIWKEFFSRGLVEPSNQLDPARLDPDNPPADCPPLTPCELQASHPRLLKELGLDFAANGFNLKYLMKKIVTSEAYQLSSFYEGTWNSKWEPLFARHYPRRLWGEEVLDSIALASNVPLAFNNVNGKNYAWSIALPEPLNNGFTSVFFPGNRDDEERKSDASVQQALSLMNDAQVINRLRSMGTGSTASLIQQAIMQSGNDEELVNRLFLTVLSRPPRTAEKATALKTLQSGTGTRTDRASSVLWALFNKVDFIFNY